jgi:hypothetical protein
MKPGHLKPKDMVDKLFLEVEQIYWMDGHYNDFTTLIIFGYFYTFNGEMDEDKLAAGINLILEQIENAEEDGAQLEMDARVAVVTYKNTHQTTIILN